jgi:small multidrug resistance family-3 protein
MTADRKHSDAYDTYTRISFIVRCNDRYALLGSIVLVAYGFIPTLQPIDNFGRAFAVYGGFFIVLSYVFGWALDGVRPDVGDWVGSSIALAGVLVALFWPR